MNKELKRDLKYFIIVPVAVGVVLCGLPAVLDRFSPAEWGTMGLLVLAMGCWGSLAFILKRSIFTEGESGDK